MVTVKYIRDGLLIGLISVAVSLLVMEFLVRAFFPPVNYFEPIDRPPEVVGSFGAPLVTEDRLVPHSIKYQTPHGIRIKPNVLGIVRNHGLNGQDIPIRTNSIGLRYSELGKKRTGEFRVLMLGDSITFSDYTIADETIPDTIERILGGDTRVINAGVPGNGTADQYYHYLELEGMVKPDVVLVGMFLDDARTQNAVRVRTPRAPWSRSYLATLLALRVSFLRQIMTTENKDSIDEGALRKLRFESAWESTTWDAIRRPLYLLQNAVVSNRASLAVVLFPVHSQVRGQTSPVPQTYFSNMCSELQIPCLDLLPQLKTVDSIDKEPIHYDFCHLTPRGNRIAAELIAPWLKSQRLVPSVD